MKKILFVTNIPSPYRVDFYNQLGESFDLTVLFEAKGARNQGIKFNYNLDSIRTFTPVFLSEGDIKEKQLNFSVFTFLRKHQFDEVVLTSYAYLTEVAVLLYLKLRHIPYYLESDGALPHNDGLLKRVIKRFLISGAKGYFSPNQITDDYLESFGAARNKVIRYPFTSLSRKDVEQNREMLSKKEVCRKELSIPESHVILFVGQIIPRKGILELLQAYKMISDMSVGLYLVGGEPSEEYLQTIKENHIQNIHFVPFASKQMLDKYYAAADIFVLPTREDVWGLVINEAMSFGLPIITTTQCGAANALVRENGLTYSYEQVDVLAGEIQELILDESRRARMGKAALDIIDDYTIENMCNVHLQVLQADISDGVTQQTIK